MTDHPVPCDGFEAAFLVTWRNTSPRVRHAFRAAIERHHDGQPFDDAMAEMHVELGDCNAEARRKVEQVNNSTLDWRQELI